jgi:predicted phosphodiesterase
MPFSFLRGDGLLNNDFEPIVKCIPSNDDITIYPISDLHKGAAECMTKAWSDFKNKIKSEPNSYLTLGGDLMNNGVKSSVSDVYSEVIRPREEKEWLSEQLYDIREKILCVIPGNHCNRSGKEVDDHPLYDISRISGVEDRYRENAAFIIIRVGNIKGAGQKNPTYTICVQHGSGGGIYTGASVNRNERFGYVVDGLDVLIVGHNHKPVVSRPQKIFIDKHNNKISFKPFTVVSSTSWLEYGSYALRKMLLPSSHVLQEVKLSGAEKKVRVLF